MVLEARSGDFPFLPGGGFALVDGILLVKHAAQEAPLIGLDADKELVDYLSKQ